MATLAGVAAPVPLEEVKASLRIVGSEEDALLAGLVRSAAACCEDFTRLSLIEREVTETLAARGGWVRLARTPVRAILEVSRIGEDGAAEALPAGGYEIDIDASGDGWVRSAGTRGRLSATYRAGLGAGWNAVPEPLRQGIVRLAAHFYTHRDAADGGAPPAAVTALWLPYRRLRLR
jgi:uncharacterized phiE125 gp8 family phage protein